MGDGAQTPTRAQAQPGGDTADAQPPTSPAVEDYVGALFTAHQKGKGKDKGKDKGKGKGFPRKVSARTRLCNRAIEPISSDRKAKLLKLKVKPTCLRRGAIGHWAGDKECRFRSNGRQDPTPHTPASQPPARSGHTSIDTDAYQFATHYPIDQSRQIPD